MDTSKARLSSLRRGLLHAAIATLGVMTIVGSGGGFPDVAFDFDPGRTPPTVSVTPSRVTVQPGDTAVFRAFQAFATSYQWRRDGVDIAGATSLSYTLVGANLGDDGARFSITVTNAVGSATATAMLQVSRFPPVLYEDGDFQLSNWAAVTGSTEPPQNGPTQSVARADDGGSPGAYRSISYAMPAGPSSITVVHTSLLATYDPAAQGAIYGIDFNVACRGSGGETHVRPLFEQAGRRFTSDLPYPCSGSWHSAFALLSLRADEFNQYEGPPCPTGQTCPDFSASGAPIRFGLLTSARLAPSQPAATVTQAIDNWKATVWKR